MKQRGDKRKTNFRRSGCSEVGAMDVESVDFNDELRRMERKIDYYKSRLQSCREKYVEVDIRRDPRERRLWKSLFVFDKMRSDEKDLHERLRDIHLSHDARPSDGPGTTPSETIRANMSELTSRRNTLMEELLQMRRNADDNDRKLAHVNAMITEREAIDRVHVSTADQRSKIPQGERFRNTFSSVTFRKRTRRCCGEDCGNNSETGILPQKT